MYRIFFILLITVILACGGSGDSSPVAPGGNNDDETPTPVNSPLEGNWSVTELEIIEAGDTMALTSPNTSGAAVFTDTDADIDVSLLGQPTVDEAGPYTFNTSTAVLTIQTDRGTKTWTYAITGDILTLAGVRSSGSEQLQVKITAAR